MTILKDLPEPSERHIAIKVKPSAERALRSGHPWLFDLSITRQNHQGTAGDLAVIFDSNNRFLAVGLFDPHSPIRVRILQKGEQVKIDSDWIMERLETSASIRLPLEETGTTGYRLVHGENDGLPGLVIDRYDETYVIRLDSAAWIPYLRVITEWLTNRGRLERVVLRLSRKTSDIFRSTYGLEDRQLLVGSRVKGTVDFKENGIHFSADLTHGQKTGFFFDQRDNRALVEQTIKENQPIVNMLNVFAYTGGFALYAARAGVNDITNIDSSASALEIAKGNTLLNSVGTWAPAFRQTMVVGDAFEVMKNLIESGKSYDLVVVDPPAFAKRKEEIQRAIIAYRQLAALSIRLVKIGGVLVSASCSSRVSKEEFFGALTQAANSCGRRLDELARTGHPVDHPIGFPEGEYLKCLFAVVK